MFKILQARFQQYVDIELSDVKTGFRKGRGTRGQIASICWIIEKAREFQKNTYFCSINYAKAFDCEEKNKPWKFFKRWEYHTTWPASWETCIQVKKQQQNQIKSKKTGSKLGKSVTRLYIFTCLFNLYAEYIMRNAGLDEAQAWIKTAGRNINNLRYADDLTFMAESEELKSLLMKVKEESEKVGLEFSIQKTKIMASGPITSWQIDGEKNGNSDRLYLGGLQNHCRWWLQPWN